MELDVDAVVHYEVHVLRKFETGDFLVTHLVADVGRVFTLLHAGVVRGKQQPLCGGGEGGVFVDGFLRRSSEDFCDEQFIVHENFELCAGVWQVDSGEGRPGRNAENIADVRDGAIGRLCAPGCGEAGDQVPGNVEELLVNGKHDG